MLDTLNCSEKVISDSSYQHERLTTPKPVILKDNSFFSELALDMKLATQPLPFLEYCSTHFAMMVFYIV